MKAILTFFIIIVLLITGSVYGQIATYTGTGGTSTAVTGYPNETVGSLQNSGFGSNTACGSGGLSGKTVPTTWTAYSTSGPRYYIKITPSTGYQLNVTGINAGMRISNTGPTKVRYAYSLDNGATWTDDATDHTLSNPGCGSSVTSSWGVGTLPTAITSTTDGIIVAVFPFAPGASAGTFQLNYLNVQGTVTNCTPPTVTISGSPSICPGTGGTTLTATGAGTGATYSWSPATGLSATTGDAIIANPAATTTYTVIGYATSAACADTTTVVTTVNPLPVSGTIIGTDSVCAGAAVALTNTSSIGTGAWSSSNTAIATVSGGTVGGVAAGSATITYIATTVCGSDTTTHTITVNPLPVTATITGSDSVCFGTSITLAASVAGGLWTTANAAIASVSATGVVTGTSATLATTSIRYLVSTFSCGSVTTTYSVSSRPQPNAGTISSNTTICMLNTTTLGSSAPGGTWSGGDAVIANVNNITGAVNGIGAGNTIITYTLVNSCGTATDTAIIHVNPLPPAITGPSSMCAMVTDLFANTLPGGTWSSSDNTIATIDATGTVYGVGAGTTTITYTNAATGCYITTPLTVNTSVPAGITLTSNASADICDGTTVTYTAHLVNGGTSPLYVWSINGVILAGTPTYTYVPADGDIVRCWFISSISCAVPDTASAQIVQPVHHIATPQITITNGTTDTLCAGVFTTFTPMVTDGGTAPIFQWKVNGSVVSTGISYSYTPANGDVISATITSNAFCRTADFATATKIVTVSPYLTPLVATTINPGTTACEGYAVSYNATQVNGGTSPVFNWLVNGVNITTGPAFNYMPANGDLVQVQLTSNFPCLATPTATASHSMTVIPVVQPVGNVTVSPGYIVNEGDSATFTVTVISGAGVAPNYQWFKNSVPISGATTTTYITNTLRTGDSINCVVTNTDQCSGISVFNSVKMTVAGNVGVSNIATTSNLNLFPNPNNGSFTLTGKTTDANNSTVTIQVVDVMGRVIYSGHTAPQHGIINAQIALDDNIATGEYLLKIITGNGTEVLHFVVGK